MDSGCPRVAAMMSVKVQGGGGGPVALKPEPSQTRGGTDLYSYSGKRHLHRDPRVQVLSRSRSVYATAAFLVFSDTLHRLPLLR